jgi:hypothetical protein
VSTGRVQLEAGLDQRIKRHDIPEALIPDSGKIGDHFRMGRRPTVIMVRIKES